MSRRSCLWIPLQCALSLSKIRNFSFASRDLWPYASFYEHFSFNWCLPMCNILQTLREFESCEMIQVIPFHLEILLQALYLVNCNLDLQLFVWHVKILYNVISCIKWANVRLGNMTKKIGIDVNVRIHFYLINLLSCKNERSDG